MSDNPPAFPSVYLDDPGHPQSTPGMTLRDWFAGQALAIVPESVPDWQLKAWFGERGGIRREEVRARAAYALADAMLCARAALSRASAA